MTDTNQTSNRKTVPTFGGRLYTYEHENGLAGNWVRRAEVDALLDEIQRLRSALASIGEYDCPGGVSSKHCLGCAACDANKALENHGRPVAPGGVGVTDLAARSPCDKTGGCWLPAGHDGHCD